MDIPLISWSVVISVFFSISISEAPFRAFFVEVFAATLGQAGAFVSAPSRSNNSDTVVLHSLAAGVRLQSVMEKPGPFSEVSKAPEYIFVGLISHSVSAIHKQVSVSCSQILIYLIASASPEQALQAQDSKALHSY